MLLRFFRTSCYCVLDIGKTNREGCGVRVDVTSYHSEEPGIVVIR